MHNAKSDKYSSRYNRAFLTMRVYDEQAEINKYVDQFYKTHNYQDKIESIKYLLSISSNKVQKNLFMDALRDQCSQVKIYILQQYSFADIDTEFVNCLIQIARNDEKVQVRALALERLSELVNPEHYDLFFSASLLKNSRESAAGLRGLYRLDKRKAYQTAKFRSENCSGNMDLAIAEIFTSEANPADLNFFQSRLAARNRLNKIEFSRIYFKMLGRLDNESVLTSHIIFICADISATGNTELIQLLILELHHFISNNKSFLEKHPDVLGLINGKIDSLLERKYIKSNKFDPFGPL